MAKLGSPLKGEIYITQTYHTQSNNTAIDLSAVVDTPVYAVADGSVTYRSSAYGSYCIQKLDNCDLKVYYVHTYKWVGTNTHVKKGDIICYIAPIAPTHLHLGLQSGKYIMDYFDRSIIFRTKYQAIKDIWFNGENLDWSKHKDLNYDNTSVEFKIGDRIEFSGTQWIREGAGDLFKQQRESIIGELATIKDGPRTSQNKQFNLGVNDSYTWWDIKFDNDSSGWVANVNKFKGYSDPTPTPDTPNCSGYIKKVEELQGEIAGLKLELETSKAQEKIEKERAVYVEGLLKTSKVEMEQVKKESEAEIKRLQEDLDLKNKSLEDTIEKLGALKLKTQGWEYWVADIIYGLLHKKKKSN